MLLDDFYTIVDQNFYEESHTLKTTIKVNKEHHIFNGHFPNNPVMPGVCMMQISKELLKNYIGKPLFMQSCNNVKFMAIINPEENPILDIELKINEEGNLVKVKNLSKFKTTVALKMNLTYQVIES